MIMGEGEGTGGRGFAFPAGYINLSWALQHVGDYGESEPFTVCFVNNRTEKCKLTKSLHRHHVKQSPYAERVSPLASVPFPFPTGDLSSSYHGLGKRNVNRQR